MLLRLCALAFAPHLEEGVPVDVLHHILNGEALEGLGADEARLDGLVDGVLPVNNKCLGLSLGQRKVPDRSSQAETGRGDAWGSAEDCMEACTDLLKLCCAQQNCLLHALLQPLLEHRSLDRCGQD